MSDRINKRKNCDTDTNGEQVVINNEIKDQSMEYETISTDGSHPTNSELNGSNTVFSVVEGEEKSEKVSPVAVTPDDSGSDTDSREMPCLSENEPETPSKKLKLARIRSFNREKMHHQTLKRTMEAFEQHKSCNGLKHAVGKCLECRRNSKHSGERDKSICRFLSFRKLRYTARGFLTIAGFPSLIDLTEEDVNLWTLKSVKVPPPFDIKMAQLLLKNVGDYFCELVKHEQEALEFRKAQFDSRIIVRKVIQGLREMCDVCSTTLFNYHFTCGKCGFAACISCFKSRCVNSENPSSTGQRRDGNKDEQGWLKCHLEDHNLQELLVTQIIAGDALDKLYKRLGEILPTLPNDDDEACDQSSSSKKSNDIEDLVNTAKPKPEEINSLVNAEESGEYDEIFGMMAENESKSDEVSKPTPTPRLPPPVATTMPLKKRDQVATEKVVELKHYKSIVSNSFSVKSRPKLYITSAESAKKYPNVPHNRLCSGFLLRLLDPFNPQNLELFQTQWIQGLPVIVSNVTANLKQELWTPESFSRDFGHKTSLLINCMTGKIVPGRKMKQFWDGFEHMKSRLCDDDDNPMLLKLKDWPPGADFKEIMPERFDDLMAALPLGEYSHRDGLYNLSERLPSRFSKPDLGPKMYIAYGSGLHLDKGTTNLHLDVSDAANVLVYVGVIKDADTTEHDKAVRKAIEESDCDAITIMRVLEDGELPGALWHIWAAEDADKIRDLLNKVEAENGRKLEQHHDPIHDQSFYLDKALRKRLHHEYNVMGYPILQCAGDSVFIPAGAPHQVRNLNNCIKIAEDFVSPENIGHCMYLTEEFRNLTETHTNHEDKLQVKNILYHTVKDAIGVIDGPSVADDWVAPEAEENDENRFRE